MLVYDLLKALYFPGGRGGGGGWGGGGGDVKKFS